MSAIINIESKQYEHQSHRKHPENWMGDGWLAVPASLDRLAESCAPYCELVIEDGALVGIMPTEQPIDLLALKSTRIAETKTALAIYLEEHPLQWADGKHYSITAEKQALLNNALAVYQIGVQAGMNPELTWNATGEECMAWEFTDLCALALGIAAYVKPLVSHQQALEIQINNATTVEEIDAVVIDYSTVHISEMPE